MVRPLPVKLLCALVLVTAIGGIALFLMPRSDSLADDKLGKLSQAWQALDEAPQWTLFSLDPTWHESRPPGGKVVEGYEVLGETVVSAKDVRQRIRQELQQAVAASKGPPAMCFNPRHAIRVRQGEKQLDVLICFECNAVHTYIDYVLMESAALQGSPDYLSGLLRAAGIPIAP